MKSTYEKLFLWAAATLVVGLGIVYATEIQTTNQEAKQGDILTSTWVNNVNKAVSAQGGSASTCKRITACGNLVTAFPVPTWDLDTFVPKNITVTQINVNNSWGFNNIGIYNVRDGRVVLQSNNWVMETAYDGSAMPAIYNLGSFGVWDTKKWVVTFCGAWKTDMGDYELTVCN